MARLNSAERPSFGRHGLGDPFGILVKELDRNLSDPFNSHVPPAPARFWHQCLQNRPDRVRAADGLNGNVASQHTALLDGAFEA